MANLGVSGSTAGRTTDANRRDYLGLLWVIAAGILGFTLLCSVSAVALGDPSLPTPVSIASVSIVDLALSDVNKGGALTAEASSRILTAIPTMFPTYTSTANLTAVAFANTSATVVIPITSFQATSTKRPRPQSNQQNTAVPKPTRTSPPRPTKTQIPPTKTQIPPTATSVPPSATPIPPTPIPPSATSVPPTAVPPTATDVPATSPPPTDAGTPPYP